jgi:hypothetical protein
MTLKIILDKDSMNTYLSKCRGAEVFLYAVISCITQKSFEQARHQPPIFLWAHLFPTITSREKRYNPGLLLRGNLEVLSGPNYATLRLN